ncbi:MAG: hypothetical protein KDC87_00925 [Planctomycetes bacterium]|nr:hypothetical protein [Planctomycetota bacterium]MCB9868831.1 hypothetical protein [Planctomycetota bacterium]
MALSPRSCITVCSLLLATAAAQSQQRLAEKRDGKLQLPFLKFVPWQLDYPAAQAQAVKSGKLIFAYFTRSDERCIDSLSLECGVFAEPEFKQFATKVVPFCHLTTGVKTDKHQDLFKAKGGTAFPRILFMDAKGKVLYVVKGERLADFTKGLSELEELAALEKRVAAGERDAGLPLLRKQLELDHLDFPGAKKRLRGLRLSKAQRAELDPLLSVAEILWVARRAGSDVKARVKAGEAFYAMKKKGRSPTGPAVYPYWRHLMWFAEQRNKPELYEEALDTLKQEFPRMKFEDEDRVLRRLKSEAHK